MESSIQDFVLSGSDYSSDGSLSPSSSESQEISHSDPSCNAGELVEKVREYTRQLSNESSSGVSSASDTSLWSTNVELLSDEKDVDRVGVGVRGESLNMVTPFTVSEASGCEETHENVAKRPRLQMDPSPPRIACSQTTSIFMGNEDTDKTFEVAGIIWPSSPRSVQFLNCFEFIQDIYTSLVDRELILDESLWEETEDELTDLDLRSRFIQSLYAAKNSLGISLATFYLSVRLVDIIFRSHEKINAMIFWRFAAATVVLASKMEEYESCRLVTVYESLRPPWPATKEDLILIEKCVYQALDYRLDVPTSYIFSNILHSQAESTKQQVYLANVSFYLLLLALLDSSLSWSRPSVLAQAVVVLSHSIGVDTTLERDVDALLWVENRLTHFTRIPSDESSVLATQLLLLFHRASRLWPAACSEFSRESSCCVALFHVSNRLRRALKERTLVVSSPGQPH